MAHQLKHSLSVSQLRRSCDPKEFKFKSTKELKPLEGIIGQDRAMHALTFGIDIQSHGYHIYALGPVGTGKSTIIRKFLDRDAKSKSIPDDWLYVNNFEDSDKPYFVRLPAGMGKEFRDDMDQLVEGLKSEVPKAFEGKEYDKEQEAIEKEFQKKSKELFLELEQTADERGFRLIQTPQGMAALPVIDGKVVMPDQKVEITQRQQKKLEKNQEKLITEMRDTFRHIEALQKSGRERVYELDRRVVGFAINHFINELKEKYTAQKDVLNVLLLAQEHLLKNVHLFKQLKMMDQMSSQPQNVSMNMMFSEKAPSFDEYRVNLIVDNSKTTGAPVVFEKNPHGPNLVGRVEHQGWMGTLVTNFQMVKGGALHKANGGYLVLEAYDLLTKPFSWQILKRALKNREISIETVAEELGALVTRTLEPQPIPLEVKVILIGDPFIYYLLFDLDQEFKELFKVKADFDSQMDWTKETAMQYAQFISTLCHEEDLRHFEAAAVARVVEQGSRTVEHQKKLATKFGDIVDLARQSSYWASKHRHKLVKESDVQQAIEEKIYRANRIEERIREMIEEGTILIDTKDAVVGQVNGLSVLQLGDYSFGKPSRITARTYMGEGNVVNIDREVKLGGPIHNKGSMILSGYLGGKFAKDIPLAFAASITFEQLYDGVEGDSASSTEIYALLSSLSELPIRQDIAVTGSVNQFGEIQAIGGVNEKIEGFFQVCKLRGLTGKQGVMIPKSNVKHLMLQDYVVDAVKKGRFHIYAVETIDEGIEILTGVTAGKEKKGDYSKNTVNAKVKERLMEFINKAKEFSASNNTFSVKVMKKSKKAKTKTKKK
ncbi:MAG: AAA family ATPase [Gammaproteobacteria bacterium]|nr:AAA family ATPase [Gammaproteobacteria bacterium]